MVTLEFLLLGGEAWTMVGRTLLARRLRCGDERRAESARPREAQHSCEECPPHRSSCGRERTPCAPSWACGRAAGKVSTTKGSATRLRGLPALPFPDHPIYRIRIGMGLATPQSPIYEIGSGNNLRIKSETGNKRPSQVLAAQPPKLPGQWATPVRIHIVTNRAVRLNAQRPRQTCQANPPPSSSFCHFFSDRPFHGRERVLEPKMATRHPRRRRKTGTNRAKRLANPDGLKIITQMAKNRSFML
jgi:hypothetical protein